MRAANGAPWCCKALERQGRKYPHGLFHPQFQCGECGRAAGLAVGAVPELCLRPGMRILTEKDGFPSLGSFDIGLVRKPGKANSAIEALARHVTESLSNITTAMIAAE